MDSGLKQDSWEQVKAILHDGGRKREIKRNKCMPIPIGNVTDLNLAKSDFTTKNRGWMYKIRRKKYQMGFLKNFFDEMSEGPRERTMGTRDTVYAWRQSVLPFHALSRPLGLTPAIRLADNGNTRPLREGYRHQYYHDAHHEKIPMLIAAISYPRLFSAFLSLSDLLGPTVDFILESSLPQISEQRFMREQIDLSVLQSVLWDYENLLMGDGHTGVAILNQDKSLELQLDEHKLVAVYGESFQPIETVLAEWQIPVDERMVLITEQPHQHGTSDEFPELFERFARQISASPY